MEEEQRTADPTDSQASVSQPSARRYYLRGFLALGGTYCIVASSSFVTLWFFATFASRQTYGAYTLVSSFAALASLTALPGAGDAVAFSVAKRCEGCLLPIVRLRMKFALIGAIGLSVGGALYMMLSTSPDASSIGLALVLLGPLMALFAGADTYLGHLQAQGRVR